MAGYLLLIERTLFVVVFGLAAVGKLRGGAGFRAFVAWLARLLRVPGRTATALAALLVTAELATVALLLVPATARLGLALTCGLLLVFIGVVVYAIRAGVLTECRCFGGAGALMSYPLIVRNALLIALALPGVAIASPAPAPAGEPVLAGLAVAAGLALAALFVRGYDAIAHAVVARLVPAPVDVPAAAGQQVGRS
jgi:hypothetical protein